MFTSLIAWGLLTVALGGLLAELGTSRDRVPSTRDHLAVVASIEGIRSAKRYGYNAKGGR